jgi:hypothetical protein
MCAQCQFSADLELPYSPCTLPKSDPEPDTAYSERADPDSVQKGSKSAALYSSLVPAH